MVSLGGLFLAFFLNKTKIVPIMLTYLIIVGYFLPISMTYRMCFYLLPFFSYVLAYFVVAVCDITTYKKRPYIFSFIISIFIICLLLLAVYSISYYALTSAPFKNISISSGTYEEYRAGMWIKDNTPKNTFVISDPASIGILIGYSNRKMSDDLEVTRGGKFPTIKLADIVIPQVQVFIEYLMTTFKEKESANAYRNIKEITNMSNNSIVVVSKRTIYWIENNYSDYRCARSCTWYPYSKTKGNISEFSHFKKFFNSTYFELIYKDEDKIYIFKLKNQIEQNESAKH